MNTVRLEDVRVESFPLARSFGIARGSKRRAEVITVTVTDREHTGIGEGVPYPRYGESVSACVDTIHRYCEAGGRLDRGALLDAMPAGAARNALDCALWDLAAQQHACPVWELAGLPGPESVHTAYTIALEAPEAMAEQAAIHRARGLLKVKLGGPDRARDGERLRAVRDAAREARLIVDVNEGWSLAELEAFMPTAADLGVELIEQPLPAAEDAVLAGRRWPVPLGADESLHGSFDLEALAGCYQVLNVKLDKTGGLTAALELVRRATAMGFALMIGCMVSTSLSMIPAMLLAGGARFVDLDGPLLLARDRPGGVRYEGGEMHLPKEPLWGVPRSSQPSGRCV